MITQQQALEALEALAHSEADGWGPVQHFTTLRQYIEQQAEDAELLDWLEEKHYALHPIKEAAGDDQYTLWWQVTDKRKSISGHPLGNIRAAIRAEVERLAAQAAPTAEALQQVSTARGYSPEGSEAGNPSTPAAGNFAEWARVWHDTASAIATIAGGDPNLDPAGMIESVQSAAQSVSADTGNTILIRLHRPEGYEDVHPELILEDAGIDKAFMPEIASADTGWEEVRMLTEDELHNCCGGCASNAAIKTWMRYAITWFCKVNAGKRIPADGEVRNGS